MNETETQTQAEPTEATQTFRIYMKSGNVMEIDKVEDLTIKYLDNGITSLSVKQRKDAKLFLFVPSVNLTQIESIALVQ